MLKIRHTTLLGSALGGSIAPLLFAGAALANPPSAAVTTGLASIASSSNKTTIDQKSEDVVINWSSFNIGAGQTTQFVQPNAQAIAVNRIGGNSASQILGTLDANGRIVLINGNGMLFGKGAVVNVGSLIATSTGGSDSDVLSGKFTQAGNQNAAVVNQGRIATSQGGLVALVAPSVTNAGTVNAKFGTVAVGAANKFTVDFAGDGLVSFAAQGDVNSNATAANIGLLSGANVSLTAHAAEGVATGVVTMSGIVTAQTAKNVGGTILLDAGNGSLAMTGTLNAAGTTGGGDIETSGNQVAISGTVTAGQNGNWKVDPFNLVVDQPAASTINHSLNAGTNVSLQTTASGTSGPGNPVSGPGDIIIDAPILWDNTSTLTLDAYHSVTVNGPFVVQGVGGLDIVTNDGGSGGTLGLRATFDSLLSTLTINGNAYTLVDNVATLASDIAGNPSGDFALAKGYNAAADGTYTSSPIGVTFTGNFEGLGNAISGLKIDGNGNSGPVGFFATIGSEGVVENIDLANVKVTGDANGSEYAEVGALAGDDEGTISGASVTGTIQDGYSSYVGGIVGMLSGGTIMNSVSSGKVGARGAAFTTYLGGLVGYSAADSTIVNSYSTSLVKNGKSAGGLVGGNFGLIEDSGATGNVTSNFGKVSLGGLVGVNGDDNDSAVITNSYATGNVSSGGTEKDVYVGGLVGYNDGVNGSATITGSSYASGAVTVSGTPKAGGRDQIYAGGLVGYDQGTLSDLHAYGVVNGSAGSVVGGLVGYAIGTISGSYATGSVTGTQSAMVGGLAGEVSGAVDNSSAQGIVSGGDDAVVGGLVGDMAGTQSSVSDSSAFSAVTGGDNALVGGLVGQNLGAIVVSFATGAVLGGNSSQVGGLVGQNQGTISNTYATGSVKGGDEAYVGGLIGDNSGSGPVSYSYESGALMGGANASVGGLVGWGTGGSFTDDYWDITTTGATAGLGGGSASPSGITALTTAQLQAWLPAGFDPSVWGRNAYTNGGLPYLLANLP